MTTARFSLRLRPELKTWLEKEAKRTDRSAGYVASKAIQSAKQATETKLSMIRQAIIDADKGVFISEENMDSWVNSWDSDNELPQPQPDILSPEK